MNFRANKAIFEFILITDSHILIISACLWDCNVLAYGLLLLDFVYILVVFFVSYLNYISQWKSVSVLPYMISYNRFINISSYQSFRCFTYIHSARMSYVSHTFCIFFERHFTSSRQTIVTLWVSSNLLFLTGVDNMFWLGSCYLIRCFA